MDELKYLIYCLHKFIHVGDVYSLKCYTKATVIFADRAVWRCEASDGLRFPHHPNSVGSCCRSGTQALQQSWDCRTPLYPCQGSCGFRLPPSVLVLCLRRVLQPMCCQIAAGGAGRWIFMLQLEPKLTAANIKKKSCCRQCASAPHLVLSVVSSDPQARHLGSGDRWKPTGKQINNFFGWVNTLAVPCVILWVWVEAAHEGEAGPSCFDGGKLLVQPHRKVGTQL